MGAYDGRYRSLRCNVDHIVVLPYVGPTRKLHAKIFSVVSRY